jgi:hypothetical protein
VITTVEVEAIKADAYLYRTDNRWAMFMRAPRWVMDDLLSELNEMAFVLDPDGEHTPYIQFVQTERGD